MVRRLLAPPSGEYNIHCSECRTHFPSRLTAGWNYWQCPNCGKKVKLLLATVRAKRGRNLDTGSEYVDCREYSIRYIDSSGEGFLRFESHDKRDIELRSRDVIVAGFPKKGARYSKKPSSIYNYSIDRFLKIR